MKFCAQCGEDRPITEFYVNVAQRDGLSPYCVAHMREQGVATRRRKRLALIAALGGCCERCGFDDPRALQIDHVHGGGRAERAAGTNRAGYYAKVLANREDYALLCANCNAIKRIEQGEHGCTYGRQIPSAREH